MFRTWAVARHMIAESIRQKIALVGFLVIVLILSTTPFVVEGDGLTLASRVQSFLAYSLGGVGFVLSVVTVFLACMAISDEIVSKRIFTVATKPLPRWQFFVGKWLGISILNAGLLLLTFVVVMVSVYFLKHRPTSVPGDKETLQFEVLNARHGMPMKQPDFTPEIEQRVRRLREEGRLEGVSPESEAQIREDIRQEFKKSWRSIGPGEYRVFEFPNLWLVDRKADGYLHFRFKPTSSAGLSDQMFQAVIRCGDPDEPGTLTADVADDYIVDRFHTIPLPYWAVNKDNTLYIWLFNGSPRDTVIFEGNDSMELLLDVGTFHWNLFRALSIIWCRLAFLAILGLLMSSFLSFPVACMACFLVLAVASASGFLATALDWVTPPGTGHAKDPMWYLGPVLRPLAQGFVWLVPDFSRFDPVSNVVSGRLVPLMWVIQSVFSLILLQGLILGVLGCIILTKRELAQET